ncbi:MAG: hypothetical protein LBU98_03145 [Alistipes sp.]|jgi:hypothetical protein|nr:hypothetical protein [Alistipes sp.]
MKKTLILTLALATVWSVAAQEDISRQLEVTRAYAPRVGRAEKLPVVPDMTDTVKLRPHIEYRITSTASSTSFETQPYAAATVGASPGPQAGPLYIRAGVGVPFTTEADIYFTPRLRAGRAFGIYANHVGSYSRILNDLGVEANATETTNGAGLWGSRQWRRYSLEGDVTYDNRLYNPYGVADVQDPVSSVAWDRGFVYDRRMHRFSLGLGRAGLSFGDNFSDLSRFNFRVGVDAGYAVNRRDYKQANFDARLTAARMFGGGKHGFELVLAEEGAFDLSVYDGGGNVSRNAVAVTFAPRYLFSSGVWSLRGGADVRYIVDKAFGQDYARVAPSFEARAVLAGGAFVPFVSHTSRVGAGDLETLSRRNPYVTEAGATAWINDARVGFTGDVNDWFSYRLSGGVSMFRDYQLFVGRQVVSLREAGGASGVTYPPMWFTPYAVDGQRWTVGAEVALRNLGGFGARLYANWNGFEFGGSYPFTPVGDLPRYDAGLELSWSGWRDRLALRLGAEWIGERDYVVSLSGHNLTGMPRYSTGVLAPAVDITFGAEVKVARDFWVYIEGENLADQVLYPYPHYRGLGANFTGGVKIVF